MSAAKIGQAPTRLNVRHGPLDLRRTLAPAMMKQLRRIARIVLRRTTAGRNLTVFPDDVFIVSYPRSGNTWTRFLIGNLLYPNDPMTFANIESRIPEIYLFPDRTLRRLPRRRVLKSHERFDARYRKVIYIVRDPRDVAVSLYHYSLKRRYVPDGYAIDAFVRRFLLGEFFTACGTWSEHVRSWYAARDGTPAFVALRYEDLLADPCRELARVGPVLELELAPEALARAVDLSTAARMRSLEHAQAQQWKLTRNTREDKPFVRAAQAGTWRSELPPHAVADIEAACEPLMKAVGYAPSGAATPPLSLHGRG